MNLEKSPFKMKMSGTTIANTHGRRDNFGTGISMEERWRATSSNDTSIWIPESGFNQMRFIRKWNKLSRLQKTLIYSAGLISIILLGLVLFQKEVETKRKDLNTEEIHLLEESTKIVVTTERPTVSHKIIEKLNFDGPVNERQLAVVKSFLHAWNNYKKYAWGRDNLLPLSASGSDWFSLGLTLVDALDTAYIMGLKEEYREGRDWIDKKLTFTRNKDVNLFEVTIRVLGALLTNFHFSGDGMFLTKAEDLGQRLLGAFATRSGIPYSDVNLSNKVAHAPNWSPYSSTAEVTTVQLEFRELSRATGDPQFEDAAAQVSSKIHSLPKKEGLVPIYISPNSGNFTQHTTITLGARGDSYYEYLLKQWIQTGKTIDYLRDDYLLAMEGVKKLLARRTPKNGYLYIGEFTGSDTFIPKMDHLTCFLPGTLALGYSHGLPKWHLEMAEQLLHTCYLTYENHPTFLAPEITHFARSEDEAEMYTKSADAHSLLRPEFVESLWYMYQITGNTTFQDWGWNIYQAFEKYARTENGYCSLNNVDSVRPTKRNSMESFFLSETLKYLYLLFSDNRYLIDLHKYVINSEAHPLPIHSH